MLVHVKPKKPYLHWIRHHDPDYEVPLKTPQEAGSIAFLIPTADWDREEAEADIALNWDYFFVEMLQVWTTDPAHWPQGRTLEMFRHWFDIDICDMIFDIG